jgi:hypothetical protein
MLYAPRNGSKHCSGDRHFSLWTLSAICFFATAHKETAARETPLRWTLALVPGVARYDAGMGKAGVVFFDMRQWIETIPYDPQML